MQRKGIEEIKNKYVKDVLEWHNEHNRGKNWGVKAIQALFSLSKNSPKEFISFSKLKQYGIPYGTQRFLSSGIVEKAESSRAYRIRKEFYEALKDILNRKAYNT
jgi:hypothetical protein